MGAETKKDQEGESKELKQIDKKQTKSAETPCFLTDENLHDFEIRNKSKLTIVDMSASYDTILSDLESVSSQSDTLTASDEDESDAEHFVTYFQSVLTNLHKYNTEHNFWPVLTGADLSQALARIAKKATVVHPSSGKDTVDSDKDHLLIHDAVAITRD